MNRLASHSLSHSCISLFPIKACLSVLLRPTVDRTTLFSDNEQRNVQMKSINTKPDKASS